MRPKQFCKNKLLEKFHTNLFFKTIAAVVTQCLGNIIAQRALDKREYFGVFKSQLLLNKHVAIAHLSRLDGSEEKWKNKKKHPMLII